MATYFEILPKELLHQILYNFYDPKDFGLLHKSDIFELIIDNPTFWNEKVRYDFDKVDFGILPDYLYKFKEIDGYGVYISNYRKLYQSYMHALKRLNLLNKEYYFDVVRPLSSVSNIKVLYIFEQNYLDNWKIDKILELYQHELFLPGNDQDGYRVVEISVVYISSDLYSVHIITNNEEGETIEYNIDRYQAFNLILHTCINGWD